MTPDIDRVSQRYIALIGLLGACDGQRGRRSEVARQLGVHPSYVTRLLNGERRHVSRASVERAMRYLGLTPDFFYGEAEPTSLSVAHVSRRREPVALSPLELERLALIVRALNALDRDERERVLDYARQHYVEQPALAVPQAAE